MKYAVSKIAEHGDFHLEDADITEINSIRDGEHAAHLVVRWRRQYIESGCFTWRGESAKILHLKLIPRQLQEIITQNREARTTFCNDCYDYGKAERPPAHCRRCLLIEACYRSGQGDLRKAQTPRRERRPLLYVAMGMIIVAMWWAFSQWAQSAQDLETTQIRLKAANEKRGKHDNHTR